MIGFWQKVWNRLATYSIFRICLCFFSLSCADMVEVLILLIKLIKVKCALKEECIAPRGSKFNGCDYTRRPTFLYSGCHRYEMSAFSIIASMLFDFDQKKYTMPNYSNVANLTTYTAHDTSFDAIITEMSERIKSEYANSFMATLPADSNTQV